MISTKFQKFAVVIAGAIAISSLGLLPKITSQAQEKFTYDEVIYVTEIDHQHPLSVALAAAREHGYIDSGTQKETIEIEGNSGEVTTQTQITITQEGFLDDSVRGHQFVIQLDKNDADQWTLTDIKKSFLCYRGMGTSGYCL